MFTFLTYIVLVDYYYHKNYGVDFWIKKMNGKRPLSSLRLSFPSVDCMQQDLISKIQEAQLTPLRVTVNCKNNNNRGKDYDTCQKRYVENFEPFYKNVHVYQDPVFGHEPEKVQSVWEDRTIVQHQHSRSETQQVNNGTQIIQSWNRGKNSRRKINDSENYRKLKMNIRGSNNIKIRIPSAGFIQQKLISKVQEAQFGRSSKLDEIIWEDRIVENSIHNPIHIKVDIYQVPVFGPDSKTDEINWEDRTVVEHEHSTS